MGKKLKIAVFSFLGILVCFASVKAATTIGDNITTMGKIGIGTITPESGSSLDVFGDVIFRGLADSDMILKIRKSNDQNILGGFYQGVGGYGALQLFDGVTNELDRPLINLSATTSVPTFFNAGSVGIGTTTPQDKLEITGGNILLSGVMNQGVILGGMGTSRAFTVDFQDLPTNGTASFNLFNQTNTTGPKDFNIFGGNGVTGYIAIKLSSTGVSYFDSGNVGIGTTTPINLFSVASSTSSLFDVTSSGQVGVGTSGPVSFAKMQINYDSASDIIAGLVVSDGGSAHVMLGATSTSGFVGNYNNNSFSIRTNNEDRIFVYDKNSGADVRVGIGTTTPDSFLQVYKNNATTTVTVGGVDSATKGSCLKLRDSDGNGWTYCTTLAGSLTCSITSCE